DGGKMLSWNGKVGLISGATGVIDSHYSVIGAMGDRFLLSRLAPAGHGQFTRALKHVGAASQRMRAELAEAVVHLFDHRQTEARAISDDEAKTIDQIITPALRLPAPLEPDRPRRSRGVGAV